MADIFISHSGSDNEIAAAIGERIQRERPTWSLFYDKDNIRAGQRWQERLRDELTSCRVVLALLSRNWLGSPWCFTETVTATFRGKDVVGIETEDLTSEDLGRAPPILHERQRIRLRDGDDRAWREILEALDRSGLDPNDWFPIPPNVGPYPGLVAFDEKDAGVFFGRKQEITEYLGILDTLRGPDRSQLLVIAGASGSGKSSLLRAGLIPRLRRKPEWVVISPFEVAREPVRNLLDRLGEALTKLDIPAGRLDLTKPSDDPRALAQILDETLRHLEQATGAWVLLPLDQAEVLVTGDRLTGAAGGLLLDALTELLGRRTRHVVVAATIRTEFVPRLEAVFAGTEVRLRQAPISAIGSLSEVIEKPAERFGIELEPGLSEKIVEDVHTSDALPLLAYTLKELYERGGGDRRLTLDEYRALGGVQGAIAAKLNVVLSDPEPTLEETRALQRAFTRYLIRVDEGAVEGERLLRRVVPRASLPPLADRIISRLVDAGLLMTRAGTIELAHERLINDWPNLPLKTWLAQDASDRRLIEQLHQRVNDDTLPDGLLAQAEELLQRDQELATEVPSIAMLVQRSRDQKRILERQRRMRLVIASTAAVVFLVVALLALLAMKRANDTAKVALSRQLAAQSQGHVGGQPDLALLLGAEASLAADTSEARGALYSSLVNPPGLVGMLHGAPVYTSRLATSADGSTLVLAACQHRSSLTGVCKGPSLIVWDLNSRKRLREIPLPSPAFSVAISPDGKILASGSCATGGDLSCDNGEIRLWSLPDAMALETISDGYDGPVVDLAFAVDGRLISRGGHHLVTWDPMAKHQIAEKELESVAVDAFATAMAGDASITWTTTWSEPSRTVIWPQGEFDKPGEPIFEQEKLQDISAAAFSRDGKTVALARCAAEPKEGFCDRGEIRLWDVATKEQLGKPLGGFNDWIRNLAFSNDGRVLAAGGCGKRTTGRCIEGELRLWDVKDRYALSGAIAAHRDEVKSLAFAGESGTLVSLGVDDTIMLWNVPAAGSANVVDSTEGMISALFVSSIRVDKFSDYIINTDGVSTTAFGQSSKLIAVNSCVERQESPCREHAIDLWDKTANKLEVRLRPGLVGTAAVAFSPNTDLLAVGGCRRAQVDSAGEGLCEEGEISLWEVPSGKRHSAPLLMPGNRVTALAFSQDGTLLASGGCPNLDPWLCESSVVRLWKISGGSDHGSAVTLDDFRISSLLFKSDGKLLVTAGCSEPLMVETTRLCHATEIRVLSIAPFQPTAVPLVNQSGWISALAITGDGRTLAAGESDGTLVLWDLLDSRRLGPSLRGAPDGILNLVWTREEQLEVRGPQTTTLWYANPGSWRRQACAVANRNFSCAEWQRYIGDHPYRATCPDLPAPPCVSR